MGRRQVPEILCLCLCLCLVFALCLSSVRFVRSFPPGPTTRGALFCRYIGYVRYSTEYIGTDVLCWTGQSVRLRPGSRQGSGRALHLRLLLPLAPFVAGACSPSGWAEKKGGGGVVRLGIWAPGHLGSLFFLLTQQLTGATRATPRQQLAGAPVSWNCPVASQVARPLPLSSHGSHLFSSFPFRRVWRLLIMLLMLLCYRVLAPSSKHDNPPAEQLLIQKQSLAVSRLLSFHSFAKVGFISDFCVSLSHLARRPRHPNGSRQFGPL